MKIRILKECGPTEALIRKNYYFTLPRSLLKSQYEEEGASLCSMPGWVVVIQLSRTTKPVPEKL